MLPAYTCLTHSVLAWLSMRPGDVDQLREAHPSWCFRVAWATANSGSDYRSLIASRAGVQASAADAASLSDRIADAERRHGWN